MPRTLLQRRLIDVSDRLKRLRAELAVTDEQCAHFEAEAEDARLRSLVSETPMADAEARETRRHADAQARRRDQLRRAVTELENEQNALLDRMAAELATTPDSFDAGTPR
jgi:chromosome segregation ATPase